MELQAVVDDSGKGIKPVFVLAGFVLGTYQWSVFADHWRTILNTSPKIDYFKMHDAAHCAGQFSRFSTQQRDDKVTQFVSLILDYKPLALKDVIRHDQYERAFKGKLARKMDYPYPLSASNIISTLHRYQYNNNWHAEDKPDFIFDEQGKEGEFIRRTWRFNLRTMPPQVKSLTGKRPVYKDEKDFLPLQAADLFAWHVRRSYDEQPREQNSFDENWNSLSKLECAADEWSEVRLQKIADGVRKTGRVFEYDLKTSKERKVHRKILEKRFAREPK